MHDRPSDSAPNAWGLPAPPGPRRLDLVRLLLREGPLNAPSSLVARYGDVVSLRIGLRRRYYLGHPDHVRTLLTTVAEHTRKGRAYEVLRLLLGDGLLTSEGDLHARQRRAIQPLLAPHGLEGGAESVGAATDRLCATWIPGVERDIHDEMMRLTLGIIGRALLGSDFADHIGSIADAVASGSRLFAAGGHALRDVLVRLPIPPALAFCRARRAMNVAMTALIRSRQAAPAPDGGLVSRLVEIQGRSERNAVLTRRRVRDEIVTLLLAGHETTALALTWTWYLLARHPEAEAKVHEEVDTVLGGRVPTAADLPRLRACRRALTEALRLRPPIYVMARRALRPLDVAGFRIPAGSDIYVSQYAMHRDPRFWTNPTGFDPDRWIDEKAVADSRSAFFPFGAGVRRCVGEGRFWSEAPIILAAVARRWRLSAAPGQTDDVRPSITLRPRDGMRMRPWCRAESSVRP